MKVPTIPKLKPIRLKSVIRPQILMSIALKNLLSKRLRTFLTMIGIIIGVGAVVFLTSLAIGLHGVVDQQVLGSKSVETVDVTTPNSLNIQLNESSKNKITQIAHVTKVATAYILPGQIAYQNSLSDTVVYGVSDDYISLSALKFTAGANHLAGPNDAIVNAALLNLIGQSSAADALHKQLSTTTTITSPDGVTKKTVTNKLNIVGVINNGTGAEVYMNGQLLKNAGASQYGQLKVVTDNRSNVPAARQQIEGYGLTTASPLDTLDQINTIFTIFTFVVIGFGGIGMVIAILGMFNTLTVSLLERTSELGLMITMGARKSDVRRLLIFEAVLLSVIGGIIGIVTAGLLGVIINLLLTHFANNSGVVGTIHAFSVTPILVVVTLALATLLGLVVAYYPSKRAGRINPIDALRHE